MKGLRKYTVFAGSLVLALAIGHVMQRTTPENHPALAAHSWSETRISDAQSLLRSVPPESVQPLTAEVNPFAFGTQPIVSAPTVAPGPLPPTVPQMAETVPGPLRDGLLQGRTDPVAPAPIGPLASLDLDSRPIPAPHTVLAEPVEAVPAETADDCHREIAVTAEPPAMLIVSVDAPCDADARLVLRHAGLAVTESLSPLGRLIVEVPAFAEEAAVAVTFPDGEILNAGTAVPDMGRYHRVAVQWKGPDAFQLHAYEFGAGFGDTGHVSAAMPRDPGHALRATGGFMNLMGDSRLALPLLAEVYTFPAHRVPHSGTVRIEIEAMVTQEVCGREMTGQTLEIRGDRVARLSEISIEMPDCDALDQFIVLQNVLEDIKVAGN